MTLVDLAKENGHVTICSLSVQAKFRLRGYGEGRGDRGYGKGSGNLA
jgi:hypothetical protein